MVQNTNAIARAAFMLTVISDALIHPQMTLAALVKIPHPAQHAAKASLVKEVKTANMRANALILQS